MSQSRENRRKQTLPPDRGLSLEEKIDILNKLKKGETTVSLAMSYKCTEMTIKLLKKSEKDLRSEYKRLQPPRTLVSKNIDKILQLWVADHANRKYPPAPSEIRAKAIEIFSNLKEKIPGMKDTFLASNSWYYKFIRKTPQKYVGDESEVKQDATERVTFEIKKLIKKGDYKPEQIFNCDEASLLWRKLPDRNTLPDNCKYNSDRMTVLFCANAAGDFKCKPLIVYEDDSKLVKDKDSLPVYWRTQKKSWMGRTVFTEWFEHCFVPEATLYLRDKKIANKILLICDDALGHAPAVKNIYPNIKVVFVPTRRSSNLLPLQKGIFFNFFLFYHKRLLNYLNKCLETSSEKPLLEHLSEFHIENSLDMIKGAWEDVSVFTMVNGWKKLLPVKENDVKERNFLKAQLDEVVKLSSGITGSNLKEIGAHLHSHDSEMAFSELERFALGDKAEDESAEVDAEKVEESHDGSEYSHDDFVTDVEDSVEDKEQVKPAVKILNVTERNVVPETKRNEVIAPAPKNKEFVVPETKNKEVEKVVSMPNNVQAVLIRTPNGINNKQISNGKENQAVVLPQEEPSNGPINTEMEVADVKPETLTAMAGVFEPSADSLNWDLALDELRFSCVEVKQEPMDVDEISQPPPSESSAVTADDADNTPDSTDVIEICKKERCGHCLKKNLLYCLINFHACMYYKNQKCTFCGDLSYFLMLDSVVIDSTVHFNRGRKFCVFCNAEYDSLTALQWHKCPSFTSATGLYDCGRCGEKLKSPFALTKHMYVHCGFSEFSCQICSAKFPERSFLRKHEMEVHEKEDPEEENIVKTEQDEESEDEQQDALVVDETGDNYNSENLCKKEVCNKCFDNQSTLGLLEFHYCKSPSDPKNCFVCSHINLHMQHEKRPPDGIIHLNPCQVRCSFCHEYYNNVEELKLHHCEVDASVELILCRECGVSRPNGQKFMLHILHHYNVRAYTCRTCGDRFVSEQRFKVHEESHFATKKFKCDKCGLAFIRNREFVRHMFAHTGAKPFKCELCGKMFAAKYMLKEHGKSHLEKRPYACKFCDRSYAKKRTLEMHQYNSHEGPQLICDICGKKLMNWSTMRTHIAVHDKDNLHRCTACYRAYTTAASLKRHLLTHSGEKKHACATCGMSFYHTYQLKLHSITHEKEKPFKCPYCIKTFIQRRQLVSHEVKCPIRPTAVPQIHTLATNSPHATSISITFA